MKLFDAIEENKDLKKPHFFRVVDDPFSDRCFTAFLKCEELSSRSIEMFDIVSHETFTVYEDEISFWTRKEWLMIMPR